MKIIQKIVLHKEELILKLTDEKAMIVVDFKQNIRLGGSLEEVSAIFYTPTMINYIRGI